MMVLDVYGGKKPVCCNCKDPAAIFLNFTKIDIKIDICLVCANVLKDMLADEEDEEYYGRFS
jgi:hypothetical protein